MGWKRPEAPPLPAGRLVAGADGGVRHVAGEGPGIARAGHGGIHIDLADEDAADEPAVAVAIDDLDHDPPPVDQAAERGARRGAPGLAKLGRVDPGKPHLAHPLLREPLDHDGIAVLHPEHARLEPLGRERGRQQEESEEREDACHGGRALHSGDATGNPSLPMATHATDTGDGHGPAPHRLALEGELTIDRAAGLERMLAGVPPGTVTVDLAAVTRIDTVGAWLVHRLVRDRPGSRVEGTSGEAARLLAEVAAADRPCSIRPDPRPAWLREIEKAGEAVIAAVGTMGAGLGFVGTVLLVTLRTAVSRRGIRWHAVSGQMEATGVNALGIIGLMSFLIGIVIAQQGAVQLEQFGAQVFTINLIGRATFRELGILLTAIMVAGRSASAFAAQIGTMKLNEELDAMRTIGLDPVEVLVVPRVIALTVIMPLLGFYASILAIIGGGLLCWTVLDIPPATYVQRIREVVPMSDFWIGMAKAPFFGAVIAMTGCFQGLQVTGTAESVGERTTVAVVQSIFLVIVLDAFFAVFFTAIGFV